MNSQHRPENDKITIYNVAATARQLMNQHGLGHWCFTLDRAKRRCGLCRYSRKTISLSRHYIASNSDADITNTILHEIAHAIAGSEAGHGPEWKAVCRKIGCRPTRYNMNAVMPKGRYEATCHGCTRKFYRHRRQKRGLHTYCGLCGPDRGKLVYRDMEKSSQLSLTG